VGVGGEVDVEGPGPRPRTFNEMTMHCRGAMRSRDRAAMYVHT
jgi:hypothetical protein